MPVVEIMMSPIMALSFYNSCKTSLSLGLALDLVLVKVVSTTSLFQAHAFWDEGKQGRISHCWGIQLQAGAAVPKLIFLPIFSRPCLFVLLWGWGEYLFTFRLPGGPPVTNVSGLREQCTVCLRWSSGSCFSSRNGLLFGCYRFFFFSFNAQPQFKCQHFFFNLNSR